MTLRRIVRIRHRTGASAILRSPLMRPGRTLRQFPFIAEQVGEEVVAPLRRCRGPNDFQAATDGVITKTFAKVILPSEALILDVGTFWFGAYILSGNAGTVGFAEGVAAGNERNGLLVIHRHAGESLPDIACRGKRIRLSIRPFRVHIDQAHLHRSERIRKITIAAVALVRQPRALRSPINFLCGLPDIFAPAAKTERLKAHRFQCDVAGENHEVSPGNFPAILLLDRPQKPPRLVQVYVVRPAIKRREALLPGSGTAAAVADAVRASAVPRHANEERPIVAKVGRPPILGVRHQGVQVLDHGIQVERLELFRVIELLTHGIRLWGMSSITRKSSRRSTWMP